MKNIVKAIGETNLLSLMENKLSYLEVFPESADEIELLNQKKIIMKYYDGTITKEEHDKNKNSLNFKEFLPLVVYERYIFSDTDILSMDLLNISEEVINEIIDLWIILDSGSANLKQFQKLILVLYCQKNIIEFETIAMRLYKEKKWSKEYVDIKRYKEKFIILMNQDKEYNLRYGINPETINNTLENNKYEDKEKEILEETNWLLEKFGG